MIGEYTGRYITSGSFNIALGQNSNFKVTTGERKRIYRCTGR